MRLPAISLFSFRNFAALVSAAVCSLISVQAGGFGGPAPFQNGSPLISGTDGIYQAVASAKNVTGLIGFAIRGGVQTSSANDNSWIMFVDGQILNGQTSANVSNDKVAGVLDTSVSGGLPTNEDGTVDLPLVFIVPGNAGAGSFQAKIDLNDPVAAFEGKGQLSGTPARTDQIVFINTGTGAAALNPVTIVPLTIPASDLENVEFKVRGTRLSTTTTAR